jgi:hypothetical protein
VGGGAVAKWANKGGRYIIEGLGISTQQISKSVQLADTLYSEAKELQMNLDLKLNREISDVAIVEIDGPDSLSEDQEQENAGSSSVQSGNGHMSSPQIFHHEPNFTGSPVFPGYPSYFADSNSGGYSSGGYFSGGYSGYSGYSGGYSARNFHGGGHSSGGSYAFASAGFSC